MSQYTNNFSSGWAQLILNVTESSTSAENNTGKISWSLQLKALTSLNASSYSGISISVTIGGKSRYTANSFNLPTMASGATTTIASGSFTKGHASDGTLSMAVAAAFTTSLGIGSASISGTFTGTTIPRSTQPTLSSSSITLGGNVTINMPRAVNSFTHKLTYKVGSLSGVLSTNLGTSYTWNNVPRDFANQITSAESGTVTIYCYTYNGSNLVGYKTVGLTVKIPSDIKPTVSLSTTEAVQAVATKFGLSNKYVNGLSQVAVQVNVDTSNAYGATVKSYNTVIDGIAYNSAAFTTGVINAVGTLAAETTIIDSRGRKTTFTQNITVLDYAAPVISIDLQTGGQMQTIGVQFTGKVYSVDAKNSKALKLKYKKLTDEVYTERNITISDWVFTANTLIEGIDEEATYEFIAELTDKMTTTQAQTTTGIICISRRAGGKGVAFFKEAERDGVDINGDLFVSGSISGVTWDDIAEKPDLVEALGVYIPSITRNTSTTSGITNNSKAIKLGNIRLVMINVQFTLTSLKGNTATTLGTMTSTNYMPADNLALDVYALGTSTQRIDAYVDTTGKIIVKAGGTTSATITTSQIRVCGTYIVPVQEG